MQTYGNMANLISLTDRAPQFDVQCSGDFSEQGLKLHFRVAKPCKIPWSYPTQDEKFHPFAQWKLWESDVVEIFLQWRLHPDDFSASYLEINFSPTGAALSLVIFKPRVSFATPITHFFKATHNFSLKDDSEIWELEVSGKWPLLICPQGHLWGAYHACLGPQPFRDYLGANIVPGPGPDFHRPQFFLPMALRS